MLTVREWKGCSGRRSRKGLEYAACYKILAANPFRNFRFVRRRLAAAEFLKWNDRNKRPASLVL